MLSHATAQEWLIPYTDGMLSTDERRRIDTHLGGCAACGGEVDALRQLNLVLVSLPTAPPLAFAPFWMKLQAALPAPRRSAAAPRYRRAGIAFAAAAFAVLAAAGSAFAAPSSLPDSGLYPVKLAEESLQLSLTPPSDRLKLEIRLGAERLREAGVMAVTGKPALAASSIRAFRLLIPSITSGLANEDTQASYVQRSKLEVELIAVQEANATRGDDDAEVKQLVLTAWRELDDETGPSQLVESVPPVTAATAPAAQAIPASTPSPTERPEPKPSDD